MGKWDLPEKPVKVEKPVEPTAPVERRVLPPRKIVPDDLDEVIRQLDHMSFKGRLNSGYRKTCERAAVLLRKAY